MLDEFGITRGGMRTGSVILSTYIIICAAAIAASELYSSRSAGPSKRDCWICRLLVTVILNLASLCLFPKFVTDALTPALLVVCGMPTAWGLYAFLSFRTRRERIVGYVAFLPVTVWTFASLDLYYSRGWDSSAWWATTSILCFRKKTVRSRLWRPCIG